MNVNNKWLILVLALLFAVSIVLIFGKDYDGFTNLTPGIFPKDVDVPILHNDYPLKQKMGVSNNSYETNSTFYPIFGSSYGQYTNNVRYWATPDNGQCSPAEFCGGLYNDKKIDVSKTPSPISFSSPDIRVNYYASHTLECPTTDI